MAESGVLVGWGVGGLDLPWEKGSHCRFLRGKRWPWSLGRIVQSVCAETDEGAGEGSAKAELPGADALFYEGIYEAVFFLFFFFFFSQEAKRLDASRSCTEGRFPATVRGPRAACISSQLMAAVPLAGPAWHVEGCVGAPPPPLPYPSAVSLLPSSHTGRPSPALLRAGVVRGCQLTASSG